MPKYFDGTKKLPFPKVSVQHNVLTSEWLETALAKNSGRISVAVKFEGLSAESLGYVFHIERHESRITLVDLKGVVFFRGITAEDAVKHIKHASGTEYIQSSQAEFARVRDEIGIDQ